jgi:DNA-binding NarL/FixJ family response regulator
MPESISPGARIFLVDDHPAIRQGLAVFFRQEGLVVCGEAENMEQTLQTLTNARPDLVLVDLTLKGENGLDLIEKLHSCGVKSIAYSMHDDARHIELAFTSGALGYVTKRELVTTLLDAIAEALAGRRYVSPVAARILADKLISGEPGIPVNRLSEREVMVFRRLGEGDATADIAGRMHISVSTVETYYARIIEKMGFSGKKELRRQAIQYIKKAGR